MAKEARPARVRDPELRLLTITQLNQLVRAALENQLDAVWVAGEISNWRVAPSGHCYFTLKDEKSQIAAVMFRRDGGKLCFTPQSGMEVICLGRVSLYTVRGDLQLYVESMEPMGHGALYLAFEQLKKRLAAEGLFAPERKKPLPFLPASIGIVTSGNGAAVYDMLRIIADRFPDRRIIVCPVRVQGKGAALEIANGVTDLARSGAVEVIIVGRGGGSLEDLWAFNEEAVARAIFASPVPVISAVGHEIDFTIADFVADQRAPTPTAAAEMVVPSKAELMAQLSKLEEQLSKCMRVRMDSAKDLLSALAKRLGDPRRKLREQQQRLDELSIALLRRFQSRLRYFNDQLAHAAGRMTALSPLAVLERGYSLVHKLPEETLVKDVVSLQVGDRVRVRFGHGKSICRVEEKE